MSLATCFKREAVHAARFKLCAIVGAGPTRAKVTLILYAPLNKRTGIRAKVYVSGAACAYVHVRARVCVYVRTFVR